MTLTSVPVGFSDIAHRVRELVCTYRPARDHIGLIVQVPTLVLNEPRTAALVLGRLVANHPIELFGVACLSARHQLLAWHLLSRGTRTSAQLSVPDVFVPAIVTPGTTAIVLVHNHPSGNATPSVDDARLTLRLGAAADLLELGLLDHLIVGDDNRYFSFREAGQLLRGEWGEDHGAGRGNRPSRPVSLGCQSGAVKPRRTRRPLRGCGLDGARLAPGLGRYVMAGVLFEPETTEAHARPKECDMKTTTTVSAVDIRIGGELRTYHAFITTAPAAFDALGTISLHASTFAEVVALAAQPIPFDRALGHTPARVVLVGSREYELQRALYREGSYLLAPTDPNLVGETTLQRLLWQRLAAPPAYEVH